MWILGELVRALFAQRAHSLQAFIGAVEEAGSPPVIIAPFTDGGVLTVEDGDGANPIVLVRFQLCMWSDRSWFRRHMCIQDISEYVGEVDDVGFLECVGQELELLLAARQRRAWLQAHLAGSLITVLGTRGEVIGDEHFRIYEQKLAQLKEQTLSVK